MSNFTSLLIFEREYGNNKNLIIINNTSEAVSYEVPDRYSKDLLTDEKMNKIVEVKAFSGLILK